MDFDRLWFDWGEKNIGIRDGDDIMDGWRLGLEWSHEEIGYCDLGWIGGKWLLLEN